MGDLSRFQRLRLLETVPELAPEYFGPYQSAVSGFACTTGRIHINQLYDNIGIGTGAG